jgi:hypothetical protein
MRRIVPLAVLLLLLAGCGGEDLRNDDPNGWKACQTLITLRQSSDGVARLNGILEAGRLAIVAESADIKASASKLVGASSMVDGNKLAKACEAHGVKIPDPVAVYDPDDPAGLATP